MSKKKLPTKVKVEDDEEEETVLGPVAVEPPAKDITLPFMPHAFNTSLNGRSPVVLFTPKALNDMYILVDESPEEIGWLGLVEPLGQNFVVHEIFLPKQEVSVACTEFSTDGIMNVYSQLMRRRDGAKLTNSLRFWGHSHHTMGTDPSGQDDQQMEEFKENGCDYFIRAILNKEGKISISIFFYALNISLIDIPWSVLHQFSSRDLASWKREIKKKVAEKTYPKSTAPNYYYSGGPLPPGAYGHMWPGAFNEQAFERYQGMDDGEILAAMEKEDAQWNLRDYDREKHTYDSIHP